ncbi:MAG: TIGR00725 family protein [Aquificae bacterium]|nr:TIGR00725 family protein [Aquificota bacterium]
MKVVSVIGSSQAKENSDEYRLAYNLGIELAKRDIVIVSGGRTGIMEAVCKGAKERGGLTIGIMPSYDGTEANPFVDIKINTGMSWNRNPIVVATGQIIVAIGGNYGTLSEIAYSLILSKRVLGYKTHKIQGVEQYQTLEEILKQIDIFFELY